MSYDLIVEAREQTAHILSQSFAYEQESIGQKNYSG